MFYNIGPRKVNEAMLDGGPKFRLIYIMPWLRNVKFYNTFKDNKARFQVSLKSEVP